MPSQIDLVGGCAWTVEWSTRIVAKGMSAAAAILTFMSPLRKQTGNASADCIGSRHGFPAPPKSNERPFGPLVGIDGTRETGLEPVAEGQLPNPHEPSLRRDTPEARRIDGVVGGLVAELRRIGEVEDLEPDLTQLAARETRFLR